MLDWYIESLNAGLKHCRPNLTLSQHSKPLPAMAAAMKAMKVMKKKAAMKVMKKKAAMKVMKKKAAMKAMKARRAMKKKSVIATGRLAKVMVLRGSKAKTVGGLKASDFVKNKAGRVVKETERPGQEECLDHRCQEGTRRFEDQGLLRDQEGHTPLRQGKGVPEVSCGIA